MIFRIHYSELHFRFRFRNSEGNFNSEIILFHFALICVNGNAHENLYENNSPRLFWCNDYASRRRWGKRCKPDKLPFGQYFSM